MKVIIAGGRTFDNRYLMLTTLNDLGIYDRNDIIIICGMARGADLLGKDIAEKRGWRVEEHPAKWDTEGMSAGYKRNARMAKVADMALVFWDQKSKGSKHMIDQMLKENKPVTIIPYDSN